MAQQPRVGQDLLIFEASRSHSDTPHSVRLIWKSAQPDAPLPNNTQHSKETDIHAPGGIRTSIPSKRAVADPRLRPRTAGKLFITIHVYLYSLTFIDICTDHLIYRVPLYFLIISSRFTCLSSLLTGLSRFL
jgi:hypothetical protein